ncbi:MAG: hypothetical protein ACQGVK_01805 [Myxococcota bacterium]
MSGEITRIPPGSPPVAPPSGPAPTSPASKRRERERARRKRREESEPTPEDTADEAPESTPDGEHGRGGIDIRVRGALQSETRGPFCTADPAAPGARGESRPPLCALTLEPGGSEPLVDWHGACSSEDPIPSNPTARGAVREV